MAQLDSVPAPVFLDPQVKEYEEGYMGLLVRVSLLLASKDFPLEVQHHGAEMHQHLLKFRREELSSADLLNLQHILTVSGPMSCPLMPFLSLGQRPFVLGHERIDLSIALNPNFLSSPTSLASLVPISCLEVSPTPYSYKAPSSSKSVLSRALSHQHGRRSTGKYKSYHWPREPHHHSLPFPVDSPVPIAYFGLGTKSSSHGSSSNKSGSSCESSSGCSGENSSSSNNNVSCMRSLELSFDEQVEYDETELEVQRLMAIDISDCNEVNITRPKRNEIDGDPEDQDEFGIRIHVSNFFADIVHPQMLRLDGKAYRHHVKGCLLLAEHNILCQAFVITYHSRKPVNMDILASILKLLNMIWTQPEWESTFLSNGSALSCLFSDRHFLKMVYNVVKACENELKEFPGRQSGDNSFISLLRLILPSLFQLLRCIHSLWDEQVARNLSESIKRAKTLMDDEKDVQQNETRNLLEDIRVSGYNVIGLCMSLQGAFNELLDSSLYAVFVHLGSMEFRHLIKLIHIVFLPLVRNCPRECWKEWMLDTLRPLIWHCEDVLYCAWFSLTYEGRAKVAYYFGKLHGSAEDIEKSEHSLLLEFTRAVSHLFGNISSPELNRGLLHEYFESDSDKLMTDFQDLESISSTSLVGYLLINDCFWSLRMSLFGYWVDDEAARKAIPFCRALILLAGVTNDERLGLFVSDELLPSLIRRVDDQLPCAIRDLICTLKSSINDDVNKDLTVLCRESYNYLSSNVDARQDIKGKDKEIGNAVDDFTRWFAKQKRDLREKASRVVPEEFDERKAEWKWEFEDEFRRYLPVYIDMLKEVDAIDTSKGDYSSWEILQKLSPEFRSKYAINSIEHPHFRAMSYMRRRKLASAARVRNGRRMFAFLKKLITHEPYIKGSDFFDSVINHLEQNSMTLDSCVVEQSVQVLLYPVLYVWEPQFHPLIREEHKDFLLEEVIEPLSKGREFEDFQPLTPDLEDFPPHLRPYAMSYIFTKLKASLYDRAQVQFHMHEEFDNYLASGVHDSNIYGSLEDDLFGRYVASFDVPPKFSALDHDLIKLSLKRRAVIARMHHEVCTYSDCLRDLLANELLKGHLTNLVKELEVEGFFNVNNGLDNWKKKYVTELIDRFRDDVFRGHSLPRHYVIRGIIDFREILPQKDTSQAFEQVVGEACNRLTEYLPQFWRDTCHYKHNIYDIFEKPLEKIFV